MDSPELALLKSLLTSRVSNEGEPEPSALDKLADLGYTTTLEERTGPETLVLGIRHNQIPGVTVALPFSDTRHISNGTVPELYHDSAPGYDLRPQLGLFHSVLESSSGLDATRVADALTSSLAAWPGTAPYATLRATSVDGVLASVQGIMEADNAAFKKLCQFAVKAKRLEPLLATHGLVIQPDRQSLFGRHGASTAGTDTPVRVAVNKARGYAAQLAIHNDGAVTMTHHRLTATFQGASPTHRDADAALNGTLAVVADQSTTIAQHMHLALKPVCDKAGVGLQLGEKRTEWPNINTTPLTFRREWEDGGFEMRLMLADGVSDTYLQATDKSGVATMPVSLTGDVDQVMRGYLALSPDLIGPSGMAPTTDLTLTANSVCSPDLALPALRNLLVAGKLAHACDGQYRGDWQSGLGLEGVRRLAVYYPKARYVGDKPTAVLDIELKGEGHLALSWEQGSEAPVSIGYRSGLLHRPVELRLDSDTPGLAAMDVATLVKTVALPRLIELQDKAVESYWVPQPWLESVDLRAGTAMLAMEGETHYGQKEANSGISVKLDAEGKVASYNEASPRFLGNGVGSRVFDGMSAKALAAFREDKQLVSTIAEVAKLQATHYPPARTHFNAEKTAVQIEWANGSLDEFQVKAATLHTGKVVVCGKAGVKRTVNNLRFGNVAERALDLLAGKVARDELTRLAMVKQQEKAAKRDGTSR